MNKHTPLTLAALLLVPLAALQVANNFTMQINKHQALWIQ